MTPTETRVRHALGNKLRPERSPWSGLMDLFQTDREAFYLLACDGVDSTEPTLRRLGVLAQQVRSAVQVSFKIVSPALPGTAATLQPYTGDPLPIPAEMVDDVRRFLQAIDGKGVADRAGKDYEGIEVSEAEVRFKLGEPSSWDSDRALLDARRNAKPLVLQLGREDLDHLETQPAYVTYELLHCARKTILAPTAVFRGLKRGGDAPPKVNNGWAFFGKPRQAYQNDGTAVPAPSGMLFVVYADKDVFVFDWDWVQEDPDNPGYPLGPLDERFEQEIKLDQDAVLDLPANLRPGQFDPTKACYSSRGDCIFCYMTDEESFAVRLNPDLTVFQKFGTNEHTGFKIKNVRRILQVDKKIVVSDPPALTVRVDSVLVAVSRRQQESAEFYAVLIRRLPKIAGEPLKVEGLPDELVTA